MSVEQRGRLITFEGIDGVGKSTQLERASAWLAGRGRDPLVTREPGGTALGTALRGLLLAQPMTPLAELLLMFAARSQHLAETVRPALEQGRVVLCDRFTDASFAYQGGGRGLPAAWIDTLAGWTHPGLAPDGTLLFDLDPELAAQRVAQAGRQGGDRFDSEQVDFFRRVRRAYLDRAAAEPQRMVVIDAGRPPAEIEQDVARALAHWIG